MRRASCIDMQEKALHASFTQGTTYFNNKMNALPIKILSFCVILVVFVAMPAESPHFKKISRLSGEFTVMIQAAPQLDTRIRAG